MSRLRRYEVMRTHATWLPDRDLDWSRPSRLNDAQMELARHHAAAGTYAEEIGLLVCNRLMTSLPDLPVRMVLALQMNDEAKHAEVFTRYAHRIWGTPPEPGAGLMKIWDDLLAIENPVALFYVQTLLEGFALDQFLYTQPVFEGDVLGDIYGFVIRDEARHVALGLEFLEFALRQPLSDEVRDTVAWCEANVRDIGFINPEFMEWMSRSTGESSSDIARVFEERHQRRLDRIWKKDCDDEEAFDLFELQGRNDVYSAAEHQLLRPRAGRSKGELAGLRPAGSV